MQALEVYARLSARRGPVNEALNTAAKEIADGRSASVARQRAYESIRADIRGALSGSEGPCAHGVRADAARGPAAGEEGKERPTAQELEDAGQEGIVFTRLNGPVTPRKISLLHCLTSHAQAVQS
jgi:hypothetical protein